MVVALVFLCLLASVAAAALTDCVVMLACVCVCVCCRSLCNCASWPSSWLCLWRKINFLVRALIMNPDWSPLTILSVRWWRRHQAGALFPDPAAAGMRHRHRPGGRSGCGKKKDWLYYACDDLDYILCSVMFSQVLKGVVPSSAKGAAAAVVDPRQAQE